MFASLELFENCTLYLNILVIGLGFVVIVLSKLCDKYRVYDLDKTHSEIYVGFFLLVGNIAVILLRIVWIATLTCIGYWTADKGIIGFILATPIAAIVGIIGGIFRAVLLIVGGGYWGEGWAYWYWEAGIDGRLFNTALYNILVAAIIVFFIEAFLGKTDSKVASLIKKNKNRQ